MLERLATMWPFAGFYGIKKAIESKTYVEAREATWRSKST
jgi:delta24-sterol reductase